jgi:hypothetical protein
MSKVRVFISFDFDHDEYLRDLLVEQSSNPDSPFEMVDRSVREPMTGDWKEKVRERIKKTDQMIVICGEHTNAATGVGAELKIAQEEKIPYFLLSGRKDKANKKPVSARPDDKMYTWTWGNLKALIGGAR